MAVDTTQAPPASVGMRNYFESFNKENEQKNKQMLGFSQPYTPQTQTPNTLQTPTAESAYQQAFPRPNNGLAQSASNAMPVPQMPQPQKQYMYKEADEGNLQNANNTFSPDDYRDGTADGVGRNFLKSLTAPTEEEEQAQNSETTKRILALGNALRHIGNIVNTSKGGPVQMYNDPVALVEQREQTERARKQAEDYKKAQLEMQQAKQEGDQDYKKFLLNLRLGDLDRQNRRDEAQEKRNAENDKRAQEEREWRRNWAQQVQNDRNQQAKDRMEMQKQFHADQLANQAANRALRMEIHNSRGSKGSGSGSGGKAILATPDGYFTAKKDLTPTQYKQAWEYLKSHGHITKDYANKYLTASSESERMALIKKAVGYASQNDGTTRGNRFRQYLSDNFGLTREYSDGTNQATLHNRSTSSKKTVAKPAAKPTAKPAAKPQQKQTVTPKKPVAKTPQKKGKGGKNFSDVNGMFD